MGGYIVKRLVSAVPVLLGITIIVFLIMSLIPGDPATAILGSYATPENVEKLNRDLGLDKPMVQRYFIWLGNMLTGDFGRSFSLNRPVLDEVSERFNATLVLAGTAFVLCSLLGILAGVISAARQYGLADKAITFVVLIGISVPSFFPRHDDDPPVRGEPALVAGVRGMFAIYGGGDLARSDYSPFDQCPRWHLAAVATGVIARLSAARPCWRCCARTSSAPPGPKASRSAASSWAMPCARRWSRSFRSWAFRPGSSCLARSISRSCSSGPASGRMLVDAILKRDLLLVQGGVVFVAACYVLFNICRRRRAKPA